ncbi:hypothetical protein BKA67DRAFT_590296 [Truncatella angustata]|uniref:FAD-binding PCMH-type domain-containing protein n=1 Tax=Truncatella angustata TaxID=152316 RepID=A0A9P8UZG7_9PEZI|nr:uncharacterized protein BKA67DRAFT_590296 [Truncatella angustata]KAH6661255.1 hypothetical protein BKA67DRAFT_590296 [Truncatella angustata]
MLTSRSSFSTDSDIFVFLDLCTTVIQASALYDLAKSSNASTSRSCKVVPSDTEWPSDLEWTRLNETIKGTLIKTLPVASSCYSNNSSETELSCTYVEENWGYSAFHASIPESVNYPIWANNSCLPPNTTGYTQDVGCHVGGYPSYVVNATTDVHIATAMQWAAARNIRIVIKGTGHDLNGRSTGANALSIWTKNLNYLSHDAQWFIPGQNTTADVIIAGSGNNWDSTLHFALERGRVLVSGVDKTVGLGGYIQGGGHGPFSSTYGLSADNVLQATVVTTTGDILTCNAAENVDLFWAIRGGGGGQYGVVTEYIMLSHPQPSTIIATSVSITAGNMSDFRDVTVNATWDAFAHLMANMPDLMDGGITGSGLAVTGRSAKSILSLTSVPPGVITSMSFWGYNITTEALKDILQHVRDDYMAQFGNMSSLINYSISEPTVTANFTTFFDNINASPSVAGQVNLGSSRLLGRAELVDHSISNVRQYLEKILASQIEGSGSMLTIGLQGGPGPRNVPAWRQGAVNPIWREVYVHALAGGSNVNTTNATPSGALHKAADWLETNKEAVWRDWAPDTGAYMNEANPFNGQWQHDYYGSSYQRLVEIKKRYDPSYSLFVWSGVSSDEWQYDMDTGKLCRQT